MLGVRVSACHPTWRSINQDMHAEEGDLRLVDGATAAGGGAQFGRLEVFFRGGWGTACAVEDDSDLTPSFSAAALQVACRELGFERSFVQPLVRAMHAATRFISVQATCMSCIWRHDLSQPWLKNVHWPTGILLMISACPQTQTRLIPCVREI